MFGDSQFSFLFTVNKLRACVCKTGSGEAGEGGQACSNSGGSGKMHLRISNVTESTRTSLHSGDEGVCVCSALFLNKSFTP